MEAKSTMPFRHYFYVGLLAMAFVLILTTSAMSVWSTNALRDSIDQVNHSAQVKENVNHVWIALGEAESYSLRYILTSRSDYLVKYREKARGLNQALRDLERLTQDNPRQRANIARLMRVQARRETFIEKTLQLKARSMRPDLDPDASLVQWMRKGEGGNLTEAVRYALAALMAEENRILGLRIGQSNALVKQTNATVLIANGLALVAGVLGFVAIRRAQRESEHSLRAELKAEQARRANEEKSNFLANMSHEIRTPMNAIFGVTQLLSESITAPRERDWVLSIQKSGRMLLGLINNVLDLSKIEAGMLQLTAQNTDLAELLDESLMLFLPQAAEKEITLTSEVDKTPLVPLAVDAQRLRQVLMNLVSNAVKYTERGGVVVRIEMNASSDPRFRDVRLTVSDSGVGIDSEELSKIFDPFHQAKSPDGKVRPGTGLGLSITRRLVHLMGGQIQVRSQLGMGTSFIVDIPRLPVADGATQSLIADGARVDFNRLRPLKILVVDDISWNNDLAVSYLRNSHHSVHVAKDGVAGTAVAKALIPDVVLMDLRMPGQNGYEARDAIKSEPQLQHTAIVAVTASSLGVEEKILRARFDGYIRKPYTALDLFAALSAIFGTLAETRRAESGPGLLSGPEATGAPGNPVPDLLEHWRQARGTTLQGLRRSMRMREISAFAEELRRLGSELAYPELSDCAGRLATAVDCFDVAAVKSLLDRLAAWPEV